MSTQSYSPDDQATIRQEAPRQEIPRQEAPWQEAPRRENPRMPEWNTRTAPIATVQAPRSVGVGVDAGKLWAGGAATAVVTGLVALVGVLVSRWIFHLPVLAPTQDGAFGDVRTTALIVIAMVAAIVATGLMHVLMLGTLRPMLFFGWIGALVTAITVMYPFSTTASMDAKIGTAVVNLAICLAALTLVAGVASRSVPEPVPTRRPRSLPVSDYNTYN